MDTVNDIVIHFDARTRGAVGVTAAAGFTSCITVTVLLSHIIAARESPFLQRQVGVFIVCLFLSDLVQSVSGMLQIMWAAKGQIEPSAACTVQAVTLLAGDLGTCFFNFVVALHTFTTVVLCRAVPSGAMVSIIILCIVLVSLASVIGPLFLQTTSLGRFYDIAGSWCFISDNYAKPRLWIHYVPIFISAFCIIVLYTSVFITVRRHGGRNEHLTAVAQRVLWYPLSYLLLVTPIAACRLAELRGTAAPQWAWDLAITLLFLSGTINGVIYAYTRRAMPWAWRTRTRSAPTTSEPELQSGQQGFELGSASKERFIADDAVSADLPIFVPHDHFKFPERRQAEFRHDAGAANGSFMPL